MRKDTSNVRQSWNYLGTIAVVELNLLLKEFPGRFGGTRNITAYSTLSGYSFVLTKQSRFRRNTGLVAPPSSYDLA